MSARPVRGSASFRVAEYAAYYRAVRPAVRRARDLPVAGGFAADSPRRAAFDLLGRVPPGIEVPASPLNASGVADREGLVAQGEAPLAAVRRIAPRLDRSVLPVQGPPGSGKTYTGAG